MCNGIVISMGKMDILNKSLHIDFLFLDFKVVGIVGIHIQRHRERLTILANRSFVCDGIFRGVGRIVTLKRSSHR